MRGIKKRRLMQLAALTLTVVLTVPAVFAESPAAEADKPVEKPQLTSEQIQELKEIHNQIFELKKQLIEKYEAYGVIDEAKAQKMIDFMARKHERLEKNGYLPQLDKKHNKWKNKWKKKK